MSKTYVFSTEYFDGRTIRTVIDGSFTPPAIFFEELAGRNRLGEPTWREFHPNDRGWNMLATCLIESALRGGARGGNNGEAKRQRRPNGESLRILRDLYSSAPDVALTLGEIVKQTGIFRTSVFLILSNPKNGWEKGEGNRWCLISEADAPPVRETV